MSAALSVEVEYNVSARILSPVIGYVFK